MLRVLAFLIVFVVPTVASAQAQWPADGVPLATVQTKISETRAGLYACYTEHVPASSREHGDVLKVRFIVSDAGRVFRVDFVESSYKSEAFEACARELFVGIDFGVKAAKTSFVQKFGLQNGLQNLTIDTPEPAGGAITEQTVYKMLKKRYRVLQECFMREVKRGNDDVEGKLKTEVVVDGRTGTMKSAKIVSSTVDSPGVQACFLDEIRSWRFPIPDDPGLVVARFGFVFKLQE